jgi:hypothetical protein
MQPYLGDSLLKGNIMKKMPTVIAAFFIVTSLGCSAANAQSIRSEAAEHPRLVVAIRELEEAIRYLEAAPHDFGGHKVAAIRDSRAAIVQLRAALAYRAHQDRR